MPKMTKSRNSAKTVIIPEPLRTFPLSGKNTCFWCFGYLAIFGDIWGQKGVVFGTPNDVILDLDLEGVDLRPPISEHVTFCTF